MKKILLLLLFALVLWIIFFLKDDRPNLNGDWTVQEAFVNNEDLAEVDESSPLWKNWVLIPYGHHTSTAWSLAAIRLC